MLHEWELFLNSNRRQTLNLLFKLILVEVSIRGNSKSAQCKSQCDWSKVDSPTWKRGCRKFNLHTSFKLTASVKGDRPRSSTVGSKDSPPLPSVRPRPISPVKVEATVTLCYNVSLNVVDQKWIHPLANAAVESSTCTHHLS